MAHPTLTIQEVALGLLVLAAVVIVLARGNWGDAFDGSFAWDQIRRRPLFSERIRAVMDKACAGQAPSAPAAAGPRVEKVFAEAAGLNQDGRLAAHEHAANMLGNPLVRERLLDVLPGLLRRAVAAGDGPQLAGLRERARDVAEGDEDFELALTLAAWAAFLHETLGADERELLLPKPASDLEVGPGPD